MAAPLSLTHSSLSTLTRRRSSRCYASSTSTGRCRTSMPLHVSSRCRSLRSVRSTGWRRRASMAPPRWSVSLRSHGQVGSRSLRLCSAGCSATWTARPRWAGWLPATSSNSLRVWSRATNSTTSVTAWLPSWAGRSRSLSATVPMRGRTGARPARPCSTSWAGQRLRTSATTLPDSSPRLSLRSQPIRSPTSPSVALG